MDNIFVYLIDLPVEVSEMVTPCTDGYTVYLNARLSYSGRVRAYHHAMRHIERNDWKKHNADEIEALVHRKDE